MPIFSAIFSSLGGPIVEALLKPVSDIFQAYFNKQITEAELREKFQQALLTAFTQVESAYADSLNKTFASFMDAAKQSKLMQDVWACVALSQLAVLLWHQVGISTLCFFLANKSCWPSSGSTVDWAYALLALCLGGGAIALKSGPGSGALTDNLKRLVGR